MNLLKAAWICDISVMSWNLGNVSIIQFESKRIRFLSMYTHIRKCFVEKIILWCFLAHTSSKCLKGVVSLMLLVNFVVIGTFILRILGRRVNGSKLEISTSQLKLISVK